MSSLLMPQEWNQYNLTSAADLAALQTAAVAFMEKIRLNPEDTNLGPDIEACVTFLSGSPIAFEALNTVWDGLRSA